MSETRIFRGSPNYYEMVEGRDLTENSLSFLSINLPPACNYNCKFCLSGMNGESRSFENFMTLEETQNLIDEAINMGVFHIEISGEGEPLLFQRRVMDIVRYADSRGVHTTIITNGYRLTEDLLLELKELNASLIISLESIEEESYEEFVNRKGSFRRAMQNVEMARKIFRDEIIRVGELQIFRFGIHSIVMEVNRRTISKFREMVGEDIHLSLAPIMHRGNARANEKFEQNPEEDEIIRHYSDASIITSSSTIPKMKRQICGTFFFGTGVRFDGEMLFDAHCYETAGVIGNIRNAALEVLVGRMRSLHKRYFEEFDDNGFCPLRNGRYNDFISSITHNNDR